VTPGPATSYDTPSLPKWAPPGKVIVEDGSVTFMDSYLWANVYDEVSSSKHL
jgi:hypothetical protein